LASFSSASSPDARYSERSPNICLSVRGSEIKRCLSESFADGFPLDSPSSRPSKLGPFGTSKLKRFSKSFADGSPSMNSPSPRPSSSYLGGADGSDGVAPKVRAGSSVADGSDGVATEGGGTFCSASGLLFVLFGVVDAVMGSSGADGSDGVATTGGGGGTSCSAWSLYVGSILILSTSSFISSSVEFRSSGIESIVFGLTPPTCVMKKNDKI